MTRPSSTRATSTNVSALANDSDPDGDDLAVCRIGTERYPGKGVNIEFLPVEGGDGKGLVLLFAKPNAKPGTYTFTYYACDFETLVPGTITLTVARPPKITAKAVPGQPGRIKVTNPADFRIRFLYGDFREEDADGNVKIVRNSSVVINVERTRIDWVAAVRDRGVLVFLRPGPDVSGDQAASAATRAKASGGGQAQTRLRSPYAWSIRATGGQYLSGSMPVGKTARSRE